MRKTATILAVLIVLALAGCKASRHFTVQTASSDVLYTGTNNALVLKGRHVSRIQVTIENGILKADSIASDTLRRYNIVVDNFKPTFVKINDGRSATVLKYRNKPIPNPEVMLRSDSGYIKGGEVSPGRIRSVKSMLLNLNAFDYNCAFKVLNYKLTTVKNNVAAESFHEGSLINSLQNAEAGDIYIFHDVLIELAGNKEQRKLNGVAVIVK